MLMDLQLKYNWNIWFHHEKDNWKLSGFKNIYTIKTPQDFWKLYNNWNKIGGIINKHLFIMKENVVPIWEDPVNINGGCWSFKIHSSQSQDLWDDLSTYLVSEKLSQKQHDITGISICLKKNNYSVIKIWNKNSKDNSLVLLNETILKKWGMDIIYIAHIPE